MITRDRRRSNPLKRYFDDLLPVRAGKKQVKRVCDKLGFFREKFLPGCIRRERPDCLGKERNPDVVVVEIHQ